MQNYPRPEPQALAESLESLPQQSRLSPETTALVTELDREAQLKVEAIASLLEPCDRITYGQKLREAAQKLGVHVRTVQRWVKKWEKEGLAGIAETQRIDKGQHRISQFWQDFIIKTYQSGNKGSKRMTPKQVALRVQAKAHEIGDEKPPHYRTVLRLLAPLIEKKEKAKSIRSPGWRGTTLSVKTREGEDIAVEKSNQVWQCDHTRVDVLLVDQYGKLLGRPWLTTVIDAYSRCVMGIWLGFDAPSSMVVALALRHAILPKDYPEAYKLNCEWGTYGKPLYFYTDGGKDFRSNHLQQIALQLGFTCHLRDRPSEGGIVERPFRTLNEQLFSTLPGYTGSNVQERPEEAEKDACLTLRELEPLVVRFIVDRYNQSIDARMGDQTRFQRWDAGLSDAPDPINEEELRICLMKVTRRTVQRGGLLQFENLLYRGENLGGYEGKVVNLRFDPRDITSIWVYRQDGNREEPLTRAVAQDLLTEKLSLDEARASSRKLRQAGKTLFNKAILQEALDRDAATTEKKSRKQRHKEEQNLLRSVIKQDATRSQTVDIDETEVSQPVAKEPDAIELVDDAASTKADLFEPIDFDELREEW